MKVLQFGNAWIPADQIVMIEVRGFAVWIHLSDGNAFEIAECSTHEAAMDKAAMCAERWQRGLES